MASMKSFFESLRAPLNNAMWSWGASNEDCVILRVWYDESPKIGNLVCPLVYVDATRPAQSLGEKERAKHITEVKNGKPCYLVMCVAKDKAAKKREIKSFNQDALYECGNILTDDHGSIRIEITGKIDIMSFRKHFGIIP